MRALSHLVCAVRRLGAGLRPGRFPPQPGTGHAYRLFRLMLLGHRPVLPKRDRRVRCALARSKRLVGSKSKVERTCLLTLSAATNRRVPHISLVFCEMWDTAGLPLKPVTGRRIRRGAPRSHQRTWDENDGRSPTTAFSVAS